MATKTESTQPAESGLDLNERFSKLSGADKAAILMLLMGEEHAAQVINHLEPKEIQALLERKWLKSLIYPKISLMLFWTNF